MSHFKCGMWISEYGSMDAYQPTGYFQTTWNGTDEHNLFVADGIYFCRMEAG